METVVLNIRRDKSLTGYAAPYRIFIDGREMTKVSSGEKVSLIIPKQKLTKVDRASAWNKSTND